MLKNVVFKVCGKCCESKDVSLFGPNAARKDKLQTYCRACMKSYMAAKQYDKTRWEESRGQESERNKAYRLKNAESIKANDRARAAIRRELHPGAVRAHNIARKHGQKLARGNNRCCNHRCD